MKTIWLFCTVIDNFGDIGVSWRLAKALRQGLNARVFLFLDDWHALRTIAPDFANEHHIIVKKWQENQWADLENVPSPDLAIETFACALPETALHQIKQNQALWLNWEYLSAENWAVQTHAMKSLQADDYPKYFWQMGFVPQSGGLIRERDFRQPENALRHDFGCLNVFVFGYASDVWADTIRAWQTLGWQMQIDCAGSQVFESLKQNGIQIDENGVSGSLKIRQIDFVPQADFDALLARYDWLFVRGEDSFVRAQFSGKPLFWHIYPQDELAHLDKLDAFWDLCFGANPQTWQTAHRALSDELNGAFRLPENERVAHWQTLHDNNLAWQQFAQNWQQYLFNQQDTVSKLADFWAQIPQS